MNDTTSPGSDSTTPLLPLAIGVTGHRDPRQGDLSELSDCVRAVFQEIREDYPHSPIVMLSPLADGADRLVARIAKDEFSARLVVPLPMARDLYEKDFNEASLVEFNNLIDDAEWFELPLVSGSTTEDIRESGLKRDKQYALVGQYIVEHCQILIALWDGNQSDKVGATAQVVTLALNRAPEYHGNPPDPVDIPFVYHVPTPRQGQPDTQKPGPARKKFPSAFEDDKQADASYKEIFGLLDRFNKDAIALAKPLKSWRKVSRRYLYPCDDAITFWNSAKLIREGYVVADTLALHFQRKTFGALKRLHVLVFLAAVFFELFAHLNHRLPAAWEIPWTLALYIALSLLAYIWLYRRARKKDYQNKYQDYRALAEGMRVQFFWLLAGLPDSVADCYLQKQRSEIRWIRLAIRIWSFLAIIEKKADKPGLTGKYRMQSVIDRWVNDQHKFFTKATERDKEKLQRFERDVFYLLWVGLGLAVLMLGLYLLKLLPEDALLRVFARESLDVTMAPTQDVHLVHDLFIVLMALAPVGAALLHNYAHKLALSEHVKQYKRMTIIFATYRKKLEDLTNSEEYAAGNELLRELGEEALVEHGEWLHLHRERPLEVPHG